MTNQAKKTIEPERRIASLDLLRGIAALSVAISHYYLVTYESQFAEIISVIFVEIFFPLSGFVLAKQILLCQDDPGHLTVFYLRRLMRTIPPYLFAVATMAVLTNNLFTLDMVKYIFFIQNIVPDYLNVNFYPIAWSLAIEEHYYLLFPLLVILTPRKRLLLVVVVFICFFQILRILTSEMFDPQFLRIGTFLRIDSIALGFFGYCFLRDKISNMLWLILLMIAGVLTAILAVLALNDLNNYSYRLLYVSMSSLFGLLFVLVFYKFRRFFSNQAVSFFAKWLGRTSYPIYLFHIPALAIINSFENSSFATFPTYIISVIAFAFFINIYFEMPILSARPKYKSFQKGPSATL
jgi:peptidoglycan/LPS O-acetylase OafA/YrhL